MVQNSEGQLETPNWQCTNGLRGVTHIRLSDPIMRDSILAAAMLVDSASARERTASAGQVDADHHCRAFPRLQTLTIMFASSAKEADVLLAFANHRKRVGHPISKVRCLVAREHSGQEMYAGIAGALSMRDVDLEYVSKEKEENANFWGVGFDDLD